MDKVEEVRIKRGIRIRRVVVEKLFGLYDYEIPHKDSGNNINTVLILYGNNGSGKTTILRLIFHLLACEPRLGHKSSVAGTKFRRIEIELSDGSKIWAARMGNSLIGTFEMGLEQKGKVVSKVTWEAGPDNVVKSNDPKEDKQQMDFLSTIASLKLSLYLLSDDRTVRITSPVIDVRNFYGTHIGSEEEHVYIETPYRAHRRVSIDPEEISLRLLEVSIERAVDWLRQQVMRRAMRGEADVNTVYSDIIKKIRSIPPKGRPVKGISSEQLCQRIDELEKRNKGFSKFGLASPFKGKRLKEQVTETSGKQLTLITRILVPYLDSLEAKLNAVNDVQNRIETLINAINSFLHDKEVIFRIARGFSIQSRSGEILNPKMLSSGERHLFLLFCNTITALDKQSIFIIDEPEISLNIKWQRNLITSLLDCAKNSFVQYIFASHSMEIVAQHMDKVVKLNHQTK